MDKYLLFLIVICVVLLSGCIDSEYELTDEQKECVAESQREYDENDVSKPYKEIHVEAKYIYGDYIPVFGVVEIYDMYLPPFDSIVEIDMEYRYGEMIFDRGNYSVFSHTNYYTLFNGKQDFYDKWYMDREYTPLPHHVLTDDELSIKLCFDDIVKVGYFEPVEHQLINLNNQTYLEFDVIVSDPHGAIKNPVLCFVNSNDKPFEGDEFRKYRESDIPAVTLEQVSGFRFNTLYDITNIVNGEYCVPLGVMVDNRDVYLNGGTFMRYSIDFNSIQYQCLSEEDIMYIYLDDLDSYLGKDISFYTKAEPVHIATITG